MGSFATRTINGLQVVIPKSAVEREEADEAVEALLGAAASHYNEGVRALQEKRVPDAIGSVRSALRIFPYCPRFLEFGLAMTTQHGDFEMAGGLLTWAENLGIGEGWPDYEAALQKSVSDWNRFLGGTSALRDKYRRSDASPSYRELLLLAEQARKEDIPPLSKQERLYLEAFGVAYEVGKSSEPSAPAPPERTGPAWRRQIVTVGLAVLVGIGVGLIGNGFIGVGTDSGASEPTDVESAAGNTEEQPDADSVFSRMARANRFLAAGDPLKADDEWEVLNDTSNVVQVGSARESLRRAIDQRLYSSAVQFWERREFSRVVGLLSRIHSDTVGIRRERLYMLGISADQVGRPDLAAQNLKKLLEQESLEDYPHYEVQAAYVLVKHLPGGEARKYSELIADKYSDTLFYNSTVRARLSS
ncbi:hypothetical protein [Salinibacter ruber]|uniref:hypothetical protein n=1 Tax=Salinibacter ruber TaxID=146919 RepID=UPI002168B131|nr:hypothetical protein [Salinibacter ruber]MCS4034445.1 hypothetical protein [Salinibacter ruber]MCS4050785.1 hypothetical protein [Salinibacter ruber]